MNTRSSTLTATEASDPDSSSLQHTVSADTLLRVRLWDLPLRLFHWLLVATVSGAVVTGQLGGNLINVHGQFGLGVVGLLVFRIVWGFLGSTHSRFVHFFPTPGRLLSYVRGQWNGLGHNPLGAVSVFLLLGLLIVQVGTGLFTNDDIAFTGPLAFLVADDVQSRVTGVHHLLGNALLIFIGVHVLAIVFYRVVKKDNLVVPMVTGYKELDVHRATAHLHTSGGGAWAWIVAVALALGGVWVANGGPWTHQSGPTVGTAPSPSPAQAATAASAAAPF